MNSVGIGTRFAGQLRAICGSEHVIDEPVELERYDILGVTPSAAVVPGSTDEIAAIVRVANERDLTVVPAGGFTQQQTGNLPARIDVLLLTTRLTGIEHYDPADLTVGVGAGFTVSQLSSMVAADGLLFPVDAPSPQLCNIGGVLATALHGPLRHAYGSVRDFCIGLRFVSGDARRAKGGGRVVKNVAGYDLMKLLIGSHGTLGIITSASFKLFPAPRQTRTYIAGFGSLAAAIEFRDRVLHSPLSCMCLELVSPVAHELVRPETEPTAWVICVRAAGSDSVLDRCRAEFGTMVSREVDGHNELELWRALQNFSKSVEARHPDALLLSLSLPLCDVRPVIEQAAALAESNGLAFAAIGRVGAGHVLAALWPTLDGTPAGSLANAVSGLRTRLPPDASLLLLRRPAQVRSHIDPWGPTPTNLGSMRAVKKALDPCDILNRGRYLV